MDSRTVNREIRGEIRPLLKEAGFTHFTARSSWRYVGSRIEVVNFQSFNSYNASVMGCTTYSFALNLGSYFTEIPCQYGQRSVKQSSGALRPEESECHFRGRLRRSYAQPEYEEREIWYIDPGGRYLEKAVHDVRMALLRDGFAWFDRLADPMEALRILVQDDERMGEMWGFGRKSSPLRHYFTGYLALRLGHDQVARDHLQKALDSDCFSQVAGALERELAGLTVTCN